jgi:phenylpropionate dioxygenase-like ring-hydroxylating dioxygenase large terminal subunit
MTFVKHPQSPLLDHCPETLPPEAYFAAGWYEREKRTIWLNNWVCVGRLNDLQPGTMRREDVAGADIIVCRPASGELAAYHNTCRHRGSQLCVDPSRPLRKLITCPYHAWSYSAADGRLVAVGHATPTPDFRKQDHGLFSVQTRVWNGFVFVKLGGDERELSPDGGLAILDNWPMGELVTGYSRVKDLDCNWKLFWENYNECLHCPGIHPELCDLVPLFREGIMGENESADWTPDQPERPHLKAGARTWTMSGEPCGPEFPGLTVEERASGHIFATIYPTMFVIAHPDYVRSVRLMPTGPETTRLVTEWYFPQDTLDQPDFDLADVTSFAITVMDQDCAAVEMNHRGLRSPAYKGGRLMPQEYEIRKFHQWVASEMEIGDGA